MNPNSISHIDLAYLAGLFDGEGSISIQTMLPGKHRNHVNFGLHIQVKLK